MRDTSVAVVTGASSGIGRALVEALLDDGLAVVAASRTAATALSDREGLVRLA